MAWANRHKRQSLNAWLFGCGGGDGVCFGPFFFFRFAPVYLCTYMRKGIYTKGNFLSLSLCVDV